MKKFLCILLMLTAALPAALLAKEKDAFDNLDTALTQAAEGHKMIFVIYGREACGNCQALHKAIKGGQVILPKSSYVVANLNCDDPATGKAFRQHYKVEGNMLPFVVVANNDGTQLAARAGYGTAKDFNDLLRDAKKQAKLAAK